MPSATAHAPFDARSVGCQEVVFPSRLDVNPRTPRLVCASVGMTQPILSDSIPSVFLQLECEWCFFYYCDQNTKLTSLGAPVLKLLHANTLSTDHMAQCI